MKRFSGLATRLNHYVLTQGFEPRSVFLFNGDGYVTGFAGVHISDCTGFSSMRSPDDLTLIAVSQLFGCFCFHTVAISVTQLYALSECSKHVASAIRKLIKNRSERPANPYVVNYTGSDCASFVEEFIPGVISFGIGPVGIVAEPVG